MSSATKGEKIVAALLNKLQIPIDVAEILTGKNVVLEIYKTFFDPAIPSFPIKTYKEIRN